MTKFHVNGSDNGYFTDEVQARLACTTAWIASPSETVQLLDELVTHTRSEDLKKRDEVLKALRATT